MALAAISTDDLPNAQGMAMAVDAKFPILADDTTRVARDYRVFNLLRDGVAAPATFIITKDGKIAGVHVGRDIGDRPSPDEILAQVDRLLN